MSGETWLTISDFPDYEVSSLGRVRRVNAGKRNHVCGIIKSWLNNKGYEIVRLVGPGKSRNQLVSRLVCIAFHGDPPSTAHEVAHGDGKPRNNFENNLRWATRTENMADALRHGTFCMGDAHWSRKYPEKRPVGEAHGRAKLTAAAVCEIRASNRRGVDLASTFGVSRATISMIRARKIWTHTPKQLNGEQNG